MPRQMHLFASPSRLRAAALHCVIYFRRKRKRWPMKKDDRDPKLIAADKLDLLKPRLGLSVQEQSYTDPFTADLCVGCRV